MERPYKTITVQWQLLLNQEPITMPKLHGLMLMPGRIEGVRLNSFTRPMDCIDLEAHVRGGYLPNITLLELKLSINGQRLGDVGALIDTRETVYPSCIAYYYTPEQTDSYGKIISPGSSWTVLGRTV